MNTTSTELTYELGTFEGFNFRDQSAIERNVTAQEVVDWDHDRVGGGRVLARWGTGLCLALVQIPV